MPLINLIYYIQIHILYEENEGDDDKQWERRRKTFYYYFCPALIYCKIDFIF